MRLFNATKDPGMIEMWRFLIARDTMHQQQWLAVIEEMGGLKGALPIPNSFRQEEEATAYSYAFFVTKDGTPPPAGRFTHGPSLDGKGEFSVVQATPMGQEPILGPARPDSAAQLEQMTQKPITNPKA